MEPKQPGNKKMPDFDQLSDRFIGERSPVPMLVIKTSMDSSDSTENNPYYHAKVTKDPKESRDYFEE